MLKSLIRLTPLLALLSTSCQGGPAVPTDKPRLNVRFLYGFCNDLVAMRRFYSEVVGLKEGSFKDEPQFGWLVYECEGFQFMFFRSDKPLPVSAEFADQPGEDGGTLCAISWSVEVPEADYPAAVGRILSSGARTQAPTPTWRQKSYWGFTVLDPMGNTVEVYSKPKEKPASTTWPAGKS